MAHDARAPVDRLALVEWLSRAQLQDTIGEVLRRFDTGEDPKRGDENCVASLLRARALLQASAPEPDPLVEDIAALDRRWAPHAAVAWVLTDEDWLACFADLPLPSPAAWWGARLDPRAPSEEAVLRALQDRRQR